VVDEERLTRLLSTVSADVHRLRRLQKTPDLRSHEDELDAVKNRFVTLVEGAASVAHHIVVSEGWQVPDSNADAFRVLASREVIPTDLADALARAAGFRNILVHQYAEVDDRAVVTYLERLVDLERFISAVTRWIDSQQG
jgi:uncharacterized protein YutE (UPF0331/DUF86 family)